MSSPRKYDHIEVIGQDVHQNSASEVSTLKQRIFEDGSSYGCPDWDGNGGESLAADQTVMAEAYTWTSAIQVPRADTRRLNESQCRSWGILMPRLMNEQ